ncbi:MAG: cysteine--tRNA ligase [Clostridiales bacterium]|nr:cysteine--tRNA ligase [Candidatus Apopatousia equi]
MLKLYNTLSRQKEEFKPLENNTVRMYSCGPTVYSFAHIGNFRAYIFMDTLRRVLKYNGFNLNGVMNITDVGHLTSDADEGEDKMQKAAEKEKKSPMEIAEFYTKYFMADAKKLNIEMPEHVVKATDNIGEMIKFVKGLVDKGVAYVVNGNVYFDVMKYGEYGILSGVNLDDQKAGARIEVKTEKKSPFDFALWIKAPENHIMKWESPWSVGYPGWHIECSAMGRKYLGETFDIHTGGVDHIPVHHENEIAQSKGLTGKIQSKFWMHVEFLQVDGGKMSKSLGNCYTISELEEKGYSALDYRYFCLNGNYTKKLNFTFEALNSAKVARERLNQLLLAHKNSSEKTDTQKLDAYKKEFEDAINDDLNLPLALGTLWNMLKDNKPSSDIYSLALEMDKVFGLSFDKISESEKVEIPDEIKALCESRWIAKQNRDFQKADEIRKEVFNKGYDILDRKDGYDIKKH